MPTFKPGQRVWVARTIATDYSPLIPPCPRDLLTIEPTGLPDLHRVRFADALAEAPEDYVCVRYGPGRRHDLTIFATELEARLAYEDVLRRYLYCVQSDLHHAVQRVAKLQNRSREICMLLEQMGFTTRLANKNWLIPRLDEDE